MNSTAAQRQALEAKRGSPDRHGNRDSLMPTLLLLHCSAPNQRASDTRRATYEKNATRNEGLVARRAAHTDAKSFAPCRPPCLALAARARARPLPVRACVHRAGIITSAARISALGWFTLRATARGAWTARVAQPALPSHAGYCVIWAVSYTHRSARGTTPRGAARAARSSAHTLLRLVGAFVPRKPKAAADHIERPAASERPPSRASRRPAMAAVQRVRRCACPRPPIRIDRLKRRRPTRLAAPVQTWRGASPVPVQMAQG